jgi:uncharacterized protein YcfJ
MVALRALGIAFAITFIASAVIAQTAITREKPLIANPTMTKPVIASPKAVAKPLAANPTVTRRNRISDDESAHLSSSERLIKGSFGTSTGKSNGLNAVNPAAVKMNSIKPNIQQQTAPSLQRVQ